MTLVEALPMLLGMIAGGILGCMIRDEVARWDS